MCVGTHVTRGLLCPQGVPDVRLAYIQFALSFLIAGDDSTIAQVLEVKGRCAVLKQSLSVTGKIYHTKKKSAAFAAAECTRRKDVWVAKLWSGWFGYCGQHEQRYSCDAIWNAGRCTNKG